MFRNWISGMGRGFSTAARTALVALACIGPAEAANFTLTLKVSPTGAGSVCAVKGGDQAQETDYPTPSSKTQSASFGFLGLGSGTVYFDAYAKASTGCTFLGWAESENGPVTVSDTPYKKSPITGRGGSKPLCRSEGGLGAGPGRHGAGRPFPRDAQAL